MTNCFIIDDTVTTLCDRQSCSISPPSSISPIPLPYLEIFVSLKITNAAMASWTSRLWRTLLNRATRSLSSGPYGEDFKTASVTID
ncbi:hypothetical protein DICVIV_14183 [Dictyocaulus viviparus]|uniref:Uncharacterized protein n=1 Tax=Dictyocaulus viviparus TaxID=29172 RepID=A0A0D8X5Z3_DICVI|nr:hypothetical protein DICVIV_14183 [Dictyocaulus viviparus]